MSWPHSFFLQFSNFYLEYKMCTFYVMLYSVMFFVLFFSNKINIVTIRMNRFNMQGVKYMCSTLCNVPTFRYLYIQCTYQILLCKIYEFRINACSAKTYLVVNS